MKNIILSHYTVKDIEPLQWKETWENLKAFGEKMAPKLAPMDIKLKLRKMILDDITEDNLMRGNMVTIQSAELHVEETPIEELLRIELYFSPCKECITPDGVAFPCRTFKDFDEKECLVLPEEFFMEATLHVAFKSQQEGSCGCSDCSSCASGCNDEELGIHNNGNFH